jgi:hypothetical protein
MEKTIWFDMLAYFGVCALIIMTVNTVWTFVEMHREAKRQEARKRAIERIMS